MSTRGRNWSGESKSICQAWECLHLCSPIKTATGKISKSDSERECSDTNETPPLNEHSILALETFINFDKIHQLQMLNSPDPQLRSNSDNVEHETNLSNVPNMLLTTNLVLRQNYVLVDLKRSKTIDLIVPHVPGKD